MTCIASIFLGLDLGLAVGLGIELITVVFRAQLYVLCVTLSNNGETLRRVRTVSPHLGGSRLGLPVMARFPRRVRFRPARLGPVVKVRFGPAQLRLAFPPPTVPLK